MSNEKLEKQINRMFDHGARTALNPTKTASQITIIEETKNLAQLYAGMCPESRELSLALTKLQEAALMAQEAVILEGVEG